MLLIFFFFKQKTAYEMRMSDWSSDVCSSDLDAEPATFAAKAVAQGDGFVLSFEDITQQLLDQRRAAWSDVARRIAHEIKNPLTPIQLAAERLQRQIGRAHV